MLPDLSGLRLKRSSNPLPCVPTGRLVTYQRATDWSTVKHDVGYPRGPYFTEGCPDAEPGCADEDRVPVDPILLVEFAENERVMILGNGRVYNPASLAEWLKSWNSRKDIVTDYRITDEELKELGLEERNGVIRDIGEAEPAPQAPPLQPLEPVPIFTSPNATAADMHEARMFEWITRARTYNLGSATGRGRMRPASGNTWDTAQSTFKRFVMFVNLDNSYNHNRAYNRLLEVRQMLQDTAVEPVPRHGEHGRDWSRDNGIRRRLLGQLATLYFDYWMNNPALPEDSQWRQLEGQQAFNPALLDYRPRRDVARAP